MNARKSILVAVSAALALVMAAGVAACDVEEQEVVRTPDVTPSRTPAPVTPTANIEPPASTENWPVYARSDFGFTFPYPPVLHPAPEEAISVPPKDSNPAVTWITVLFQTVNGTPGIGLVVAPNPEGLTLEDWVRLYPGWPSQPTQINIDGADGLRFEIDQMGQVNPQIYFSHKGYVITIQGILEGGHTNEEGAIEEAELEALVSGLKLE